MPPIRHTPGCGLAQDPYELGAAGMPYTTQADYLPLPAEAMSTAVGRERLKKGYVTEEIGDGVYYITNGSYDAMFVRTGNGVVIIDMPPCSAKTCVAPWRK
jgi:hypothetical protein